MSSYAEAWAQAFGLASDSHERQTQRQRYARLKDALVFKIDSMGSSDPLSALVAKEDPVQRSDSDRSSTEHAPGWDQYFTDEGLLYEINTDLDRLYPVGKESFFQNELYLGILRHVLFVWCKLHPDVSYRQGMHDVAAVVFYAFLVERSDDASEAEPVTELPEQVEPDTFLLFEGIMMYLKPFYEVVKTSYEKNNSRRASAEAQDEPRLFSNYSNGDASQGVGNLHGQPPTPSGSNTLSKPKQAALHRLCHHIQYELLQQKDPQLYYHLQNLEIVPETYCLRWIRLLFAREFTFEKLFTVWDGLLIDSECPKIQYPNSDEELNGKEERPTLSQTEDDVEWLGFPLLRYVCVAKLLELGPDLRKSDNTGCLRLLMHSNPNEPQLSNTNSAQDYAVALVEYSKILRNPMLAATSGPDGVDVVQFTAGSLGIVLTAAKRPFENRLAIKNFTDDPQGRNRMGQAEACGKVKIGDLLESINGVPVVGVTTEEVKRHIQLISRPLFMGFRHSSASEVLYDTATLTAVEPESSPELVVLPYFLPGELCYAHVETSIQRFVLSHDGSCLSHYISGKLYITNYRCFFMRLLGRGDIDWQIPVLSIASIDGMDIGNSGTLSTTGAIVDHAQAVLGFASDDTYKVVIRCKDTQIARLSFSNYAEYSKLFKCLSCLAYPASLLDAFCFAYSPIVAPSEEVPFDIRREYQRIGLLDYPDRLRCIDQSARYDLCDTYPQHLVVPAEMSDLKIKAAAAFRSHNRLPVVSWLHRGNGATISRSSQPLVGLKSARSLEDELLVRLLCCSSNQHCFGRYVIIDARGQLAAVGNKAMGKGTEIVSNYRGAKLVFMNIDNIHAIRQSLQQITSIFEPRKGMNEDSSSSYYSRIESSGWLRHVRLVLKASSELAHSVHNGISVLTHCSDGWDRTAQMVSLAELMLDPFYRTLRGVQVLIEKEWCSFGHQFGSRCGHARSDVNNDQRSPVFLMWLDCVWQFMRQFPSECEFNENFLLALADHVFSCKFGTFMFDCERQR